MKSSLERVRKELEAKGFKLIGDRFVGLKGFLKGTIVATIHLHNHTWRVHFRTRKQVQ